MNESRDRELDEQLRRALGSPAAADFDAFRRGHADAVAYLHPVVTAMARRRRQMFSKIFSLSVAAAILAAVGTWLLAPRETTFAQTVRAIEKAESISMTIDAYTRMYGEDEQKPWLKKEPRWERAYMAPGHYRDTRYDKDGNVSSIDIEDAETGKWLHLDMKKKMATRKNRPSGQFGPGIPFGFIANVLEKESIEYVGQRGEWQCGKCVSSEQDISSGRPRKF